MDKDLHIPLSETTALSISPSNGGHRVGILIAGDEVASSVVTDLQRLFKRAGSVVAASPIELSNDHRTIVVKLRGRTLGRLDKASLVGIF